MRLGVVSFLALAVFDRSSACGQESLDSLLAKARAKNPAILRAAARVNAALEAERDLIRRDPVRLVARTMSHLDAATAGAKKADADFVRAQELWNAKKIPIEEFACFKLATIRYYQEVLVAREGINLCWDDVRIYLLARGIRNFDKEAIIKQSQRLDPELAISELLTRLAKQQLRLIRQRELDKVDALFWETGRLRQALMEARTKFESAQRLHAGQAVSKTDLLENYYLPYRITEQRVVEAERRMARLVGDQPEIVEE